MPVSSTKTRSLGSICRIRSQKSDRSSWMSARSCSLARSVFFFAPKPEPPQGAAQRRPADPLPSGARRQVLHVFVQRAIVPLAHQRPQDRLARRVDAPRPPAAVRLGTAAALRARLVAPEIYRRETDPKAPGNHRRRETSLISQQHPIAQVG